MFPFSESRRFVTKTPGIFELNEESFGYELVHFDKENINAFAAQVRCCEPHWHDAPEFIYILEGGFSITINTTTLALRQGGMIYINGGEIHSLEETEPGSTLLTVQFAPELFKHINKDLLLDYRVKNADCYTSQDAAVATAFHELLADVVESSDATSYHKMSLTYLLLARLQDAGILVDDREQIDTRQKDETLIKDSIEYINANYGDSLTLDQLAKRASLSYHHFSKLFKKISGYNFKEYLNYVRINKARFLLRNTTIPITDISYRCGFSEHKYLIAVFRKHYSMTPTEYRKTSLIHDKCHRRNFDSVISNFKHIDLTADCLEKIAVAPHQRV